jgi:hypothetical protein
MGNRKNSESIVKERQENNWNKKFSQTNGREKVQMMVILGTSMLRRGKTICGN